MLGFIKREKFLNFILRHIKVDLTRLHRLIDRYGTGAIFIAQYIYGFRLLSAVVFGLSTMGPKKYFPIQFLSCIIWAVIMTLTGYFFGYAFQMLIGDIQKYVFHIAIVILGGGLLIWIVKDIRRQRNN